MPKTRSAAAGQVLAGEALSRLVKHSCNSEVLATHNMWVVAARSTPPVAQRGIGAVHRRTRGSLLDVPQTASSAAFSGAAFWQTKEDQTTRKIMLHTWRRRKPSFRKIAPVLGPWCPRRSRPLEPIGGRSVGANHRIRIERDKAEKQTKVCIVTGHHEIKSPETSAMGPKPQLSRRAVRPRPAIPQGH